MSPGHGEGKSFLNLLFEVVFIAAGVFLALWANNWHEQSEHRALATSALRNFAGEMETNRQAMLHNRQYHESLARDLQKFLQSDELPSEERFYQDVHFQGLQPVTFEHTAWDLALATQALSYIKPELAFQISKVYTQQGAFQTLESNFLASAFTPAGFASENRAGLAKAMSVYMTDVNIEEPIIVQHYEKVIPEVRAALP
ncbi:MAG: hypothetical protein H0X40_18125 [Chthoniobacterales bacterium]|nr:hypothetical protein [Chthoniobacterales bacterium]